MSAKGGLVFRFIFPGGTARPLPSRQLRYCRQQGLFEAIKKGKNWKMFFNKEQAELCLFNDVGFNAVFHLS